MILTVSGWRDWTDHQFVRARVGFYVNLYAHILHVRVGNGRGVDAIVANMCSRLDVPHTIYIADWATFGKPAGPIRNGRMLKGVGNPLDPNPDKVSDKLLAFPEPGVDWWRDKGSGTGDCIRQAWKLGIDLDIPGYKTK